MISPEYVRIMARYNRWQNKSLYGAADALSEVDRTADRGAFFGSIHGTLGHLLWGDTIWMSRFDGWDAPGCGITDSARMELDWTALKTARVRADTRILEWAGRVAPSDLEGALTWYSGAMDRKITKPRALLIMQLFNHQTHHRGQVHAMLTAAGARPDDTDLPFMPEDA